MVDIDMEYIKSHLNKEFHKYCEIWGLTHSEKLLLKDYTEQIISPTIFKKEEEK